MTLEELLASRDEHRPALQCSNGWAVSLQASEGHYCSPRLSDWPFGWYDEIEVAIIHKGALINPRRVEGLSHYDWVNFFEDWDASVAGYVPKDIWLQIVTAVERLTPGTLAEQNAANLKDVL